MESRITTAEYLQEYIFRKLLQDDRKFLSGKLLVKFVLFAHEYRLKDG